MNESAVKSAAECCAGGAGSVASPSPEASVGEAAFSAPSENGPSAASEGISAKDEMCSKSDGGDEDDILRRMRCALADDEAFDVVFKALPSAESDPPEGCLYSRPPPDEVRTQNMGMGLAALLKLRAKRKSEGEHPGQDLSGDQELSGDPGLASLQPQELAPPKPLEPSTEQRPSPAAETETSDVVFEEGDSQPPLPTGKAAPEADEAVAAEATEACARAEKNDVEEANEACAREEETQVSAEAPLPAALRRIEAAAAEDSLAIARVAEELLQRLKKLPGDEGPGLAAAELGEVEQRLRWAVEALEGDVAALQRRVVLVQKGADSDAASQTGQQEEAQGGEAEEEAAAPSSSQPWQLQARKFPFLSREAQRAAVAGGGVWSETQRLALRAAAASSNARSLARARRSRGGARGSVKEAEASRLLSLPPVDALSLAASQTRAKCLLTQQELRAAVAAASATAASLAASFGPEASAFASAAASEVLSAPACSSGGEAFAGRGPWMPAHDAILRALSAANHEAAFAAGLSLLRDLASVAAVQLRASPSPAASAFAASSSAAAGTAAGVQGQGQEAASVAGVEAATEGLRRAAWGAPCEDAGLRRGPIWVETQAAEEDDEGMRGGAGTGGLSGEAGGAVSAHAEQLVLCLRRELFPPQWLRRLPLACRAQLFLPAEEEERDFCAETRAADSHPTDSPSQPQPQTQTTTKTQSQHPLLQLSLLGAEKEGGDLPRSSSADGASPKESFPREETQGPLRLDEALQRLSEEQRRREKALGILRKELLTLMRGLSTRQQACLAACVESLGAAEVQAALEGDAETSPSTCESPVPGEDEVEAEEQAAASAFAAEESCAAESPELQLQRERLQAWLQRFPELGLPAHFAVALLTEAVESSQQQQRGGGEPESQRDEAWEADLPKRVQIPLQLSALMPHPDEDPGVEVVFSLPLKPPHSQPWRWSLRLEQQQQQRRPAFAFAGADLVETEALPQSLRRVREAVAARKRRLHFFLQQQKAVCRALYKGWRSYVRALRLSSSPRSPQTRPQRAILSLCLSFARCIDALCRWRRQQERRRAAKGDIFGWGVLPVRAIDHPSLLVALPAGFRQGNPREPYENRGSRAAEEAPCERGGSSRRAAEASRRTLRGDACNDRQRAKEEAASRESKRDWMQANFANLTGPGVFWRDSCLFTLGLSLRQRCERMESGGVLPVQLLQGDPDYEIFDWARECTYLCTATRVFAPVEEETERKAVCVWAESEARTFVEKFLMYPKNFEKIASCLDGKTTRDCVDFYYRFKFKFGLKRRLQELEDGARGRKKQRQGGSKQFRREELVAEAVAGLASDCSTQMMNRFNAQNLLPFDAFTDLLLHRDALKCSLKDPLASRGEEWADSDSDDAEVFVENMRDGYFLPATCRGLVAPGRLITVPAEGQAANWQNAIQHREAVPGCVLFENPAQRVFPATNSGEAAAEPSPSDEDATSTPFLSAATPGIRGAGAAAGAAAFSASAATGPLTLKFEQLDTLLTCIEAASRRFSGPDDDGPSYMTRSRAARSKPLLSAATSANFAPSANAANSAGACFGSSGASAAATLPLRGGAVSALPLLGAGSGVNASSLLINAAAAETPQSPRARGQDALLLRLRGAVRTVQQQNAKLSGALLERQKCLSFPTEAAAVEGEGGFYDGATAAAVAAAFPGGLSSSPESAIQQPVAFGEEAVS